MSILKSSWELESLLKNTTLLTELKTEVNTYIQREKKMLSWWNPKF